MGNDVAEQLGGRIRELRGALSLTQEELAERADISVSFLSMMERGERMPRINTLARVAEKLGITLSQLFRGVMAPVDSDRQVLDPLLTYLEKMGANSADVAAFLLVAKAMFRDREPA